MTDAEATRATSSDGKRRREAGGEGKRGAAGGEGNRGAAGAAGTGDGAAAAGSTAAGRSARTGTARPAAAGPTKQDACGAKAGGRSPGSTAGSGAARPRAESRTAAPRASAAVSGDASANSLGKTGRRSAHKGERGADGARDWADSGARKADAAHAADSRRRGASGGGRSAGGGGRGAAGGRGDDRNGGAGNRRHGNGGARGGPPRGRRRTVFGTLVRLSATLFVFGVLSVSALVAYYAATMPPISAWQVPARPPNVAILSEDGQLIANRGDTGGRAIRLSDLPDHVPNAVIAIEDRRFRSHLGIDPVGLARAMVANLRAGSLVQGGSTLTQQLAKNLFLDPARTVERKIQEMILAVWLEWQYDKDEILQMYLNRVYLGAGAIGVDGAARRYFSKPAEDLTIAEAALIAGLLKAPSYFAPTVDLERANERAATVLAAMVETGAIDPLEATITRQNPATLKPPPVATSGGYVADWVNEVLPGFAGSVTEDIVVETTVNLELQELAQSALQALLAEEGKAKNVGQGAVVVLDTSGAVKALVGGKAYEGSQYNRAVAAARQPGSAFKPFVYLAALEDGLTPQTMRIDGPTRIGRWTPQNYNRKYLGPVSLTKALAYSLNTVAAQLAAEVGPREVVRTARRMGIRSALEPNASIALGTSEVTLLELTTAYVPFSNGGVGVIPHVVRRIRTADGRLLYERRGSGPGEVADLSDIGAMNRMLAAALTSGTAQRAALDGWQAAGKTGTSQDWRDAWFVGYTAFFTAGVWLGNDDNSPTDRATGGSLPATLWKRLMTQVHEGMMAAPLPGVDREDRLGDLIASSGSVPLDTPWAAVPADDAAAEGPPTRVGARNGRDWITPAPAENAGRFFRQLIGQ